MKNRIKNIILIIFIFTLYNCTDEYFDVNTPSGSATEDQLRMADLIGPSTFNTFIAQYWAERSLGNYSQYITGQGGGAIGQTTLSSTWSTIYLGAFPDLNVIIKKAEEKNATHFKAVANILIAVNLGLLTDSWDNVPYSEATQFEDNLKPAFDLQQDIYLEIDSLLDSAISALNNPDNSGFSIVNDMIYNGNKDQWLRAAYTLKARYQMHLIEHNGVAAATAALASLANGFTSNSDDFEMKYPGDIQNPWYLREIKARDTGNNHDKIGDQFVNYMNGNIYALPTVGIDPRLSEIVVRLDAVALDVPSSPTDPWRGFVNGGDGLSSDGGNGNANFAVDGFYTNSQSPIIIITYAEAQFLKAEAEFIVAGGNTTSVGSNANAYAAYMAGIQANMDKLSVSGGGYMAEPSIDVGTANLMLHHIMKEKYIANFLNPETFVDFRRYNFSSDVFKDLALPVDNADGEFPGEWLVRAQYPSSEAVRNPINVNANKQRPTIKVWWDQ